MKVNTALLNQLVPHFHVQGPIRETRVASKPPMIVPINHFSIPYEMLESIRKCYGVLTSRACRVTCTIRE